MPQCKIRSFSAKPGQVQQDWFHVDATDKILGRLASRIATILMGKHKPEYTPHVDTGDFIVVTNADKIRLTGNKADSMVYQSYSYYPGGHKIVPYKTMMKKHPERILEESVRRMLPKSALGKHMLAKLKVYATDMHPHAAQHPEPMPE